MTKPTRSCATIVTSHTTSTALSHHWTMYLMEPGNARHAHCVSIVEKTLHAPATSDGKPKKRPAWRPKKNKILVQYPEYIQDSFFGKDFMVKCPDKVEDDDVLPPVNEKKLPVQNDGKTIHLHRDALAALEELKSK